MDDWKYLPEDVSGHTMALFMPEPHQDGRFCMFHQRLGVWTFKNIYECLRSHDELDCAMAWSAYRLKSGMNKDQMGSEHKAFKAGWKAANGLRT